MTGIMEAFLKIMKKVFYYVLSTIGVRLYQFHCFVVLSEFEVDKFFTDS